jgi:menaquinone-dependent protoporphyrinogen IX oxidase
MKNTEDEHFGDSFNNKSKKDVAEEIKRVMAALANAKKVDGYVKHEIFNQLGEPDKIEEFTDGNLQFERYMWMDGTEVRMEMIMMAPDSYEKLSDSERELKTFEHLIKNLTINELNSSLVAILKDEEYEKAVLIRDEINKR